MPCLVAIRFQLLLSFMVNSPAMYVSVGASYKFLPSFSDHKLILYCTLLQLCLCLLDAVVRYSCLPSNALFDFIAIACRAVNIEKFCQHSWKVTEAELHLH